MCSRSKTSSDERNMEGKNEQLSIMVIGGGMFHCKHNSLRQPLNPSRLCREAYGSGLQNGFSTHMFHESITSIADHVPALPSTASLALYSRKRIALRVALETGTLEYIGRRYIRTPRCMGQDCLRGELEETT